MLQIAERIKKFMAETNKKDISITEGRLLEKLMYNVNDPEFDTWCEMKKIIDARTIIRYTILNGTPYGIIHCGQGARVRFTGVDSPTFFCF